MQVNFWREECTLFPFITSSYKSFKMNEMIFNIIINNSYFLLLKNRLKDNDIELTFDFDYIKEIVNQIQKEKVKVDALSKKVLSEITPFVSGKVLSGEKNIKLFVEKDLKTHDHMSWVVLLLREYVN